MNRTFYGPRQNKAKLGRAGASGRRGVREAIVRNKANLAPVSGNGRGPAGVGFRPGSIVPNEANFGSSRPKGFPLRTTAEDIQSGLRCGLVEDE